LGVHSVGRRSQFVGYPPMGGAVATAYQVQAQVVTGTRGNSRSKQRGDWPQG
jgi:hypothetical protein